MILFTVPVNLQYRFTGDSCRDCTDRQQELYDSGLEAFDAEDYDTAKSDLGSLLAERPDVYLANFCLGEIAFSRGRYGTALEFYQRAVDLAPAGQVSSAYNDCIMGVGDRTDAQVVDLRGEFEKAHILSGVSSYEYFADHIHCNDRGHRLISELLFEFISADYADSLSD